MATYVFEYESVRRELKLLTIGKVGLLWALSSHRLTVVRLYDASKLLFATNFPSCLRNKRLIKHIVAHPNTPVWPFGIVMFDPAS